MTALSHRVESVLRMTMADMAQFAQLGELVGRE
jgi:hypothetical protein